MEITISIAISVLAILISVFTIWNNNRIALYKLRYDVYLELREALFHFLVHKQDEMLKGFEKMGQLRDRIFFLFGKDINQYYLEIVNTAEKTFSSLDSPTSQAFKESTLWLVHQVEQKNLMKKFSKYIKLKSLFIQ